MGRADRDLRGHLRPDPRRPSGGGRQRPRRPALDRVILMVANVPWQKAGDAGGQLGRGPPGAGRGGGRRRARPGGGPAGDRPGRGVLHRRHPGASCTQPQPGRRAVPDRRAGTWRPSCHWERSGDPDAGHPGGGQPPGSGRPPGPRARPAGGWRRSPSRTWRSRAPTCGPGPPTAGRSTTWSPRPAVRCIRAGVCTLETDDDGPLGSQDRLLRPARSGGPASGYGGCTAGGACAAGGVAGRPARVILALTVTVTVLAMQWLDSGPSTSGINVPSSHLHTSRRSHMTHSAGLRR